MIPTTMLIADLHRQVIAHAGRTKKGFREVISMKPLSFDVVIF
jgi:hypothetical protein